MNTTSANLNSAAAINALTERANAAIDAAVDKVRNDLMEDNLMENNLVGDYVISVRNMGHNLKQVVRDNAAYGLAALITHRMLALVAERLHQFEGKVYNVRVERMMNDCLAAAIEQSVEADIKIRAYIDSFNPRTPCGVRHCLFISNEIIIVSIHALLIKYDQNICLYLDSLHFFNPCTPLPECNLL